MKLEKPSVLITSRNSAEWVGMTLARLTESKRDFLEIIFVDDGSTDSSVEIAKTFSKDLPIRILIPGEVGRGNALNIGVDAARSNLISVNDADDLSLPGRFQSASVAFAKDRKLVAIGSEGLTFMDSRRPDKVQGLPSGYYRTRLVTNLRLLFSMPFPHSSITFRKNAWAAVNGYSSELECAIDYDFLLRIARLGTVRKIRSQLVAIRLNPESHFRAIPHSTYVDTIQSIIREQLHSTLLLFIVKKYWVFKLKSSLANSPVSE